MPVPFSEPVRAWFDASFPAGPTPAQEQGWPAIAGGAHTLILAPTGSGKTLAAFLWGIDQLSREPPPERGQRCRLLYVSPLRALAADVERNLRAPLAGIGLAAERLGRPLHVPTVAVRTGDTPAGERRRMRREPPDVLITTPESLFLLLTSQARETLTGVRWVIVDEIHALAGTKRGAHLAVSLERLAARCVEPPQRIGLSATQRPLDEIARFLGGHDGSGYRPVTVVDAGASKPIDVRVVVPVEDMGRLGEVIDEPVSGPAAAGPVRASIWPAVHPRILELVRAHRSTLVFVNARRLAERLAARLNELDCEQGGTGAVARAHHGSLSREQRRVVEDQLKAGTLPCLVATSSLELGVDMGAVDLVIQVESPGSVASGLQRIGRAGHRVGEPSRGVVFPKHRGDLVEATVVVRRMREGAIEHTRYPRNPLDVLAQQVVAMCAIDEWPLAELAALVRRAAPFADLGDDALTATLDLLAGRYPSDEFAELRPRIVWDRVAGTLRGRRGAQRVVVANAGTIPDRGLFGVFLPDGTRVGELDEEMVYESRPGETFLLGASTWRIEQIGFDRVVVTPAPGEPGKMPFWHGDRPGRPMELGAAIGAFVRELRELEPAAAVRRLTGEGLDAWAAENLVRYLDEQAEATGALPDDRTIVVERFRDEIGDWRVCIHSPFGSRVHAPWAMVLRGVLEEQLGQAVELIWSDDGIVLRLPEAVDELPLDAVALDPDTLEDRLLAQVSNSALFTTRFREAAGRALLLPRRRPGSRTPLWQQRQKAADLLAVASRHPQFPVLLETTRELLADVFDVPGLRAVLTGLRSRRIRLVPVDTRDASPFATSLLFGWIAAYMYEYDAPLAERRAAALGLDRQLLSELLGAEELRELLDAGVLADLELELQHLVGDRRARDADEVHDLLRRLGPLTRAEIAQRCRVGAGAGLTAAGAPPGADRHGKAVGVGWVDALLAERRAVEVPVAGEARVAAVEDVARLRDALGVPVPAGVPQALLDAVPRPLDGLVARHARTHGPFTAAEVAARLGATPARVEEALGRLVEQGRLVVGEFRPPEAGGRPGVREHCDVEVLRVLRRRSLAALRREIEPVEAAAFARFLPAWQGVGEGHRGLDAVADAVSRLQGAAVPASVLEADVLPARVRGYAQADLDQLLATGEVVWLGAGPIGAADGRVRLFLRDQVPLLAAALRPPAGDEDRPEGPVHQRLRAHLAERGASFWPELLRAAGAETGATPGSSDGTEVLEALWDLVWAGEVTNDTFAPLRARLAPGRRGGGSRSRPPGRRPRPGRLTRSGPPAAAGRWSLVDPLFEPLPAPTEAVHALCEQLLDRHGIVTREGVLAEGVPGGFASVYPVLRAMEEAGRVRRGWFVAGLGAAQFALPGAVERLRVERAPRRPASGEPTAMVLAATDPAQPYGAALAWPDCPGGRPARTAGALVVLVGGDPAAYLERGGRSLLTFPAGRAGTTAWLDALVALVKDGRLRRLQIARIDGQPAGESSLAPRLREAGFADGYRGLTLRA